MAGNVMQGTAFMLMFALCADSLMDKLGLMGFAAVGLAVLGAAGALVALVEEGI